MAYTAPGYSVTLGTVDVNVAWRKVQGAVVEAAQFFYPEFSWFDDYVDDNIPWSLRETTIPVDLNTEVGAGFFSEGGTLMKPSSVNMTDLTVPLTQLGARFSASKLAKYASKGDKNEIENQLKMQAAKKAQAVMRKFAISSKGTSLGTIWLTDTDIPNATSMSSIVPKDGFGLADVDDRDYLVKLLAIGDRVAFVDGSSYEAGTHGSVTAIVEGASGTINIGFDTTATGETNNNLKLVGAASTNNTALAGTDYNKALNGWADFLTASTLHGIASASYAKWSVGSDTSGGRLSMDRLWKATHTINNRGGGTLNTIELSQGVWRDLVKQEAQLVRHDSVKGMEIDGSVKYGSVEFRKSQFSIPQYAICYDKKSYRKVSLLPKPGKNPGISWKDGKEMIDEDGYVFEINMALGLFCTNRANTYYFSALTEA